MQLTFTMLNNLVDKTWTHLGEGNVRKRTLVINGQIGNITPAIWGS